MRLPNSTLQRIAAATHGSIMEPGDGELIVDPVLLNTGILGAPIHSLVSDPARVTSTHIDVAAIQGTGATAAQNATVITLGAGIWYLQLSFTAFFTGTTDVNSQDSLLLVDPAGNSRALFQAPHGASAFSKIFERSMWVVLPTDDWLLRISHDAIIAGDSVAVRGSCFATKLQ